MQLFELLSRMDQATVLASIGCLTSKHEKKQIKLRFLSNECGTVFNDVEIKKPSMISVGQFHCLVGRGSGVFLHAWLCIPGNECVPCWNSTTLIAVPYKREQPFDNLLLELEESINKVLEPTPA